MQGLNITALYFPPVSFLWKWHHCPSRGKLLWAMLWPLHNPCPHGWWHIRNQHDDQNGNSGMAVVNWLPRDHSKQMRSTAMWATHQPASQATINSTQIKAKQIKRFIYKDLFSLIPGKLLILPVYAELLLKMPDKPHPQTKHKRTECELK